MRENLAEYLRPKPAARSPVNRAVAIASPPGTKFFFDNSRKSRTFKTLESEVEEPVPSEESRGIRSESLVGQAAG